MRRFFVNLIETTRNAETFKMVLTYIQILLWVQKIYPTPIIADAVTYPTQTYFIANNFNKFDIELSTEWGIYKELQVLSFNLLFTIAIIMSITANYVVHF